MTDAIDGADRIVAAGDGWEGVVVGFRVQCDDPDVRPHPAVRGGSRG